MIGLQLGDEFLNVPVDLTLNFDLLHPSFTDNLMGGGYSFPLEFDRCPVNDKLLNFPSKFDFTDVRDWDYAVKIYKNGSFWKNGRLYIDRPGTDKIGCFLRIGLETFQILDKKLSEVDYGGDILLDPVPSNVRAVVENNYILSPDWRNGVFFPMVYNPDFYGDKNPDFLGYLNNWDFANNMLFVNGPNSPNPSNITCLVPMPYTLFILKKIFEQEGYLLHEDNSLFSTMGWDSEWLYSNYALDSLGDPRYKIRASSPSTFWGYGGAGINTYHFKNNDDSTGLNYDLDNRWGTASHEYTIAVQGTHNMRIFFDFITNSGVNNTGHAIRIKLEVMHGTTVLQDYGWQTFTTPLQHNTIQAFFTGTFTVGDVGSVLWVRVTTDGAGTAGINTTAQAFLKIDALENSQVNVFNTIMNIKNHVPDKTVREFLEDLKLNWGLSYVLDEGLSKVYLQPLNDSLTTLPTDVTLRCDPTHSATLNSDRIKSIGYNWPSDDNLITDNFKTDEQGNDLGDFDGVSSFPTTNIVAGQTLREKNTNKRYRAANQAGITTVAWKFFRDDYTDFIIDKTYEQEIKLNNTPLFMHYDSVLDKYFPEISQTGSSLAFGTGINGTAQRFCFISSATYGLLPYSSSCNFRTGSTLGIPGGRIMLQAGVPIEILSRIYAWLQLRSGKFIWEKNILMNILDLERLFLLPGSGSIMDPVKIEGINFIIKKISLSLGQDVNSARMELLKMP